MNLRLATLLIALSLPLAGCGNKGPLTLPPKPVPVDPATVPATPAGEVPVEVVPEAAPATDDVGDADEAGTEAEAEAETDAAEPPPIDDGNG
jgi:predicted small lipoprotein YifL